MNNKPTLINLFISGLIFSQFFNLPPKAIASKPNSTKTVIAQQMNQLTEEKVLAIMEIIEKAEAKEDVDTILEFLAPFVISAVTVDTQETTITTYLEGKQAHRDFLIENYKLVQEREPIDSYTTVRVNEDQQIVTVTRLLTRELVTEDEREFISSSTDIIRFAWIDNKPMIINITVKGWIEERP